MIPQESHNNIQEDLVESEWDESPVADLRTIIRMFNEHKEELKEHAKTT
jgi:hypothetical protein